MEKVFSDLPAWRFEAQERANNYYFVTGKHNLGPEVERTGADIGQLFELCRKDAMEIESRLRTDTKA